METKNKKPFFSVVIPCYNDGRYAPGCYIDSLLSNILEQGLEKDDYEVIISDDHSIIPYQGTLDRYRDKMNIKFVETDYNFGPGNTRQRGVEAATGEWVCFADHDDLFYIGALSGVKYLIEQHEEKYVVYSDFNKVDGNDITKVVEKFTHPKLGTWVHGKFYNLNNFWKPFNIHFKKDLKTHEDLYLGKLVECALHSLHRDPMYIKSPVYMWVQRNDSLSHKDYTKSKDADGFDHEFIESHFDDFLSSQIDPIVDSYKQHTTDKSDALALTISSLGAAFLVSSSFKAKDPEHYLKITDYYISRKLHEIQEVFNTDITSMKVIIKVSYRDLVDRLDSSVASDCSQQSFLQWLDYVDNLDYALSMDSEVPNQTHDLSEKQEVAHTTENVLEEETNGDHRPFFSVIIPCYNDGRYTEGTYLDRLLKSLTRQQLPKYDLEVICADDCSPVPFDHILAKYKDDLIIKYIKTDYNFAPGNTRAKGLTIATGQWLCFADHDDIYYDPALKIVKDAIISKDERHFIFGDFNGVSPEGKVLREYKQNLSWCHAKFYNKDNFWDKYGIHFIHDLKSHEDIAICTQVSCLLSTEVKQYTYLPKPIYAWTDNPQSVSHAKYTIETEDGPREFLEVFYGDYIQSTGYIYLEKFKEHSIKMVNAIKWCLEIICYCYFYMQGFEFRKPEDFYRKNLDIAGEYVTACKKAFNLTNESIYNTIASNNAFMYYQVQELANPGSGRYIPSQTLQDWLEIVSPDI